MTDLLSVNSHGLYCAAGDFYIDPWRGVERAIITHAHSDHARWGSRSYLCAEPGGEVLRARLGAGISLETMAYGETRDINGVRVSLHPAGHLLGSAQVRVEHRGEVWVASGDYKTAADPTCAPLEVVRCHTFITESTFGLPIYRWQPQQKIFAEMNHWWAENAAAGRTSVVFTYALGKAQRVLGGLDASVGPILVHGAVERFQEPYRNAGIALPDVIKADADSAKLHRGCGIVIAPPSAEGTPYLRKFGDVSRAFCSGWMTVRGARRRRAVDRGFVLSDHADWPGLLATIAATGAENVAITHGYTETLARYLNERGLNARTLATQFEGEVGELNRTEQDEIESPSVRPESPEGL